MKKMNKKERKRIITAMVIASSIVLAMNPEIIFAMEENSNDTNFDKNIAVSDAKIPDVLKQTSELGVDDSKNVHVSPENKENEIDNSHKELEEQAVQNDGSASEEENAVQNEDKQKMSELKAEVKLDDKSKDVLKTDVDQNLEEKTDDNTDKSENSDAKEQVSVLGENTSTANDNETDLDISNPIQNEVLKSPNPSEEKTITLLKNGEDIGGFDSLKEIIDKMYELTKDGKQANFTVVVNNDIELTEYSQFSFPYGDVVLKSKDPSNPRTIKSNKTNHKMMLGVVNGAKVTVEDIIIDGNKEKRLFWLESTDNLPVSLTINDGAILQNGNIDPEDNAKSGGAIYSQGTGDVTINGGIIKDNEALTHGGAISFFGKGTLTINGGEITNNKVENGQGGAIYLQGNGKKQGNETPQVRGMIKGGKIYNNTAKNGGGIAIGTNAELEIAGGEISENIAEYAGGGIYLYNNSLVKLSGGKVSKNKGKYGGGVTGVYNSQFIMEGNGSISENESLRGGGIYAWGSKYGQPTFKLISGTIEKNGANYGGGIRIDSINTEIGRVLIQENVANYGGGIYSNLPEDKELTIVGVKLYNNEALSGGGVCLAQGGSLNFKNSEFKENKAYYGGGIWTNKPMNIERSFFEGNEALKSEPSILPDGKHENNGHGGAIYVNTELANDGVVTIDNSTFKNNKADKSGGAISIDETKGLVKIINNTVFEGNQAIGELGHGGAIYSNLHAYMPDYDDGSTGPLVQPPTAKDYYYNINTDKTTVFNNNKAFRTFTPPSTKDEFVKLLYQSTSHPGTKYDHPLNNDDINLIIFKQLIFHKNYETEDSIFDAFLIMEKSKLGEDFPKSVPTREGYIFKKWNTKSDGKGDEFTGENIIEDDMIVYATYDMEIIKINEAPKLVVQDKTINKGDNLNLMDLVESATDKEDGDLREKVSIINDGGFDKDRIGVYSVRFKVTDSIGASMVKIAKVSVVEKQKPDQPDKPTEPDKPIEPDNSIKPNEPDLPIIPIEPSPIDDDTIKVVVEPEDKPIYDVKPPKQDEDEEVEKLSKPEERHKPVLIDPTRKKQSANPKTGIAPGMSLTSIISTLLGSTFGLHILKKKKD